MPKIPVTKSPSSTTRTLTRILPDETLYSWFSTIHLMSCGRSASATGLALLSAAHASRQHGSLHSVAKFISLSKTAPSSTIEVLRKHTIAGFYLPFLSDQDQQELALRAQQPDSAHWSRRLLGSSRTQKLDHPLKWCTRCISDDLETFGRPIWHAVHQFPTALLCGEHDQPLSWNSIRCKQWRLPHKGEGSAVFLPDHVMPAARSVAALGSMLQMTTSVDMRALRRATIYRLQEIGVIHSENGARHERIARWFSSTTSSNLARIAQPKLNQLIAGISIPKLLWRQKRDTAFSWVLLWSALEWTSSEEAVRSFSAASSGIHSMNRSQLPLFDDFQACAKPTPDNVRDAFQSCDSYAEVMSMLGASRHDVVRWLESDIDLRLEWRARLRKGRMSECIERIVTFGQSAPHRCRADLEKNCSAEFRWLREHAPNQLATLLKSVPNRNSPQSIFTY